MTLLFALIAMFGISTVATVAWIVLAPKSAHQLQPVRTRNTDWAARRMVSAE